MTEFIDAITIPDCDSKRDDRVAILQVELTIAGKLTHITLTNTEVKRSTISYEKAEALYKKREGFKRLSRLSPVSPLAKPVSRKLNFAMITPIEFGVHVSIELSTGDTDFTFDTTLYDRIDFPLSGPINSELISSWRIDTLPGSYIVGNSSCYLEKGFHRV